MKQIRITMMVAAAAILAGLAAACGGDDAKPAAAAATPSTPVASATSASATAATSTPAPPTATAALPTPTTPPTQPAPTKPAAPPAPSGASVGISEDAQVYSFTPANVTVAAGGTVTWGWSGTDQFHNVDLRDTSGATFKTSGDPAKDGGLTVTFSTPGTYVFVCDVHESSTPSMRGTVTVR